MILTPSPPFLVRWCAVISQTASGMRTVEAVALASVAIIGVAASIIMVPDWRGLAGAGLAVLMAAIAAVDARRFIIPDELTGAALALGLVYAAIEGADGLAPALAFAALRGAMTALAFLALRASYRGLRGREGIGLGDVKLAGVAGVWLDWSVIPIAIEIAAVAALGAYLVRHLWLGRPVTPTIRMPFGLFLAPAIWIGWILETTLLADPSGFWF